MTDDRVLIACVAENRRGDFQKVVNLFRSIKAVNMGSCRLVALFVEAIEPEYQITLKKMGVDTRVVQGFDRRCPHANKLRMLEIDESRGDDVLVALDIDTVVVSDFSEYLDEESVKAKPVDMNPMPLHAWRRMFEFFELPLPAQRFRTSFHNSPTVPYFNSGVLIVPKRFRNTLRTSWGKYVIRLLDSYGSLGREIAKHRFFTDQFALSLALQESQIPFSPLPIEMNFPTHAPIHPAFSPNDIEPIILHYHHRIQANGQLEFCAYDKINRKIEQLNRVISSE